jgi:hypothetical protein
MRRCGAAVRCVGAACWRMMGKDRGGQGGELYSHKQADVEPPDRAQGEQLPSVWVWELPAGWRARGAWVRADGKACVPPWSYVARAARAALAACRPAQPGGSAIRG